MEITPSRKRFSVTILDETFKTQKSLIERLKPMFESLGLQKNQHFIQAFVSTYDKVQRQNKTIKRVVYKTAENVPSYYKESKCLHVIFTDNSEVAVSYKNVVSACFDPDGTALRNVSHHKNQQYRLAIAKDITHFRACNIHHGCVECKISFLDNWDSPMPHVDHCGDKEFRHLVADFENQTEEKDFAKYHEARAELQMLCENCNLRKGKS